MQLKYNIPLVYTIGSLMWMRFFIPVLALFYIASQVPIEQFSVIMSVFALVTLLFEIPSGVVADLLGKKNTLLLSRFFYIVEIVIIIFGNGFWPFLIAKIISGLGVSLSSGTNSALVYETLQVQKRTKDHKKISGNLTTITSLSMAVVFILGSFLFTLDYKLPAIVSLPFIVLGFILTFFLTEPFEQKKHIKFKHSFVHFKKSMRYFFSEKKLTSIAIYSIPIATVISISLSLSSAYLAMVKIPLAVIGTVSFIGSLGMATSAKHAHTIETKIKEKASLYLIQALILIAVFLMMLLTPYVGAIWYLLIPLTAGFYQVVLNHYVNETVLKEYRATMISIKNMGDNIGIFIFFPIVGYITKSESFFEGYTILFFFVLIGSIVYYLLKKK